MFILLNLLFCQVHVKFWIHNNSQFPFKGKGNNWWSGVVEQWKKMENNVLLIATCIPLLCFTSVLPFNMALSDVSSKQHVSLTKEKKNLVGWVNKQSSLQVGMTMQNATNLLVSSCHSFFTTCFWEVISLSSRTFVGVLKNKKLVFPSSNPPPL